MDDDAAAVVDAGNSQFTLHVLHTGDGSTMWERRWFPSRQSPGMGPGRPVISGGNVIGLDVDKQGRTIVYGADDQSGGEEWTRAVAGTLAPVQCGPFVCLGLYGATETSELVALDPTNGEIQWRAPGRQVVLEQYESRVITTTLGVNPQIAAYATKTGEREWVLDIEKRFDATLTTDFGWQFRSIGDVLVGWFAKDSGGVEADAVVVAIDPDRGRTLWTRSGETLCLLDIPGVILLCNSEGKMSRVSSDDGRELWNIRDMVPPEDGGALYGVAPSYETLTVRESENVVAVDVETGELTGSDVSGVTWTNFGRHVRGRPKQAEAPTEFTGPIEQPVPWNWESGEGIPIASIAAGDVPLYGVPRAGNVAGILDHEGGVYGVAVPEQKIDRCSEGVVKSAAVLGEWACGVNVDR